MGTARRPPNRPRRDVRRPPNKPDKRFLILDDDYPDEDEDNEDNNGEDPN